METKLERRMDLGNIFVHAADPINIIFTMY